jgi:branched-chain amino acid transport system permease protein
MTMRNWFIPLGLAVLLLLPPLLSDFWIFIFIQIIAFSLYAVSFNLLLGYGGMLAFGYATFFGLGAYAFGILLVKIGAGVVASMLAAPFIAAAAGALIAYFCIRLSGIYFGMLTFAFQMLVYSIFLKSYDFAGGDDGLRGLVIPGALGTPKGIYYFALMVVALCLFALWRIVHSPFGIVLRAQRNNERKSRAIGINVDFHKWSAFVISSYFAGVAGVFWAIANQSVFPDWLDWRASAVPIVMAILGGTTSFAGPIVGAALYVILQTVITGYTEYWALFMGCLILVIVMLMPQGVIHLFARRHHA